FFQAEDGIRDRNVTGVQTCALPIWNLHPAQRRGGLLLELLPLRPLGLPAADRAPTGASEGALGAAPTATAATAEAAAGARAEARSEERRVGRACRAQRPPERRTNNA